VRDATARGTIRLATKPLIWRWSAGDAKRRSCPYAKNRPTATVPAEYAKAAGKSGPTCQPQPQVVRSALACIQSPVAPRAKKAAAGEYSAVISQARERRG